MTAWWPNLTPLLAGCIPLLFTAAALSTPHREPMRRASTAAWLAALFAAAALALAVLAPTSNSSGLGRLVRIDAVTGTMLALVCAIALVIVRYSRSYLRRDPGESRYARAFAATLAAVTTLVLANHLVVIALAWVGTSLALHQLLTFFRERTPALLAAHKKFLLSRLADACVLAALTVLGLAVGSLNLDDVNAWAAARGELPASVDLAAVLLVAAVALKSAQLPFHGWLTQVMEAPTPVSALLHAGIVNIGGFLMIRLAALMAHAPVAQALLVIVGTATAVVAALVMSTRVSVKVALAWSTIAQMGFMLVQCGLGLWHLALLHLVAHSIYKAHAFLAAGSAVEVWRVQALAPPERPVGAARMVLAAAFAVAGVAVLGAAIEALLDGSGVELAMWPLAMFLGPSLAPIVARAVGDGARRLAALGLASVGVTVLYCAWHAVAVGVFVRSEVPATTTFSWVVAATGFALLFGLQVALQEWPQGRLARALAPRLFAGLYLDELFTRLTFRLWPPVLPKHKAAPQRLPETLEA